MRLTASVLLAFAASTACLIADAANHPATAAAATTTTEPASRSEELAYRLGVGDVVHIEVHNEPDLKVEALIPETGSFEYPFLGSIKASGLTVAQLRVRITQGLLGDYLIKPDVSVRVARYRPFYVRGQVKDTGGFPYILGLTVEKAITVAGGFTDRASLRSIYVIRENGTQDQRVKVNLDSPIAPGDTIIVEESLF